VTGFKRAGPADKNDREGLADRYRSFLGGALEAAAGGAVPAGMFDGGLFEAGSGAISVEAFPIKQ
jgi:hypothetical protein